MVPKDSCLLRVIPIGSPLPHWIGLTCVITRILWIWWYMTSEAMTWKFHLSLSWIIALGEASCHVLKTLTQLYGEAEQQGNVASVIQQALICQTREWASLKVNPPAPDKPSHDITALVVILTATLWGCPQRLCGIIKVNCCLSHCALW